MSYLEDVSYQTTPSSIFFSQRHEDTETGRGLSMNGSSDVVLISVSPCLREKPIHRREHGPKMLLQKIAVSPGVISVRR